MSSLIQLIYASSATRLMTDEELVELLRISRQNNHPRGITGMLLYRDGNFLQVLEGEAEAVDALYNTIAQDPRHHNILLISRQAVAERSFPEWEMGFTDINGLTPDDMPGFTDFLKAPFTPDTLAKNPSRAMIFLETFRSIGYGF